MTAVNASSAGGAAVPHLSLDPFSIEYFDDLHPSQERLREAGPLVYLDKWKVYGVARYAEVHAVLNDPATFCSSRGVGLSDFSKEKPWRPPSIILEADPPEHTRTRAVLSQVLSPTALKQVRDRFAAAAAAKVDELLERRSFDAIADLAEAYPLAIFPDALGLKQEGREHLLPYAGVVFNAFGPPNQLRQDAIERSAPHQAYVAEQCQRENLTPGGFGACIHARVDAGDITAAEAPLLVRSLLSAGLDTTVNGIGAAVYCLARYPDQLARLRQDIVAGAQCVRGGRAVREPGADVLPHHDAGCRDRRASRRRRRESPDVFGRSQPRSAPLGESRQLRHHTADQRPCRLWLRHPYVRRPARGPPGGRDHAGGAGAQGRGDRDHRTGEAPLQQYAARAGEPSCDDHAGLTRSPQIAPFKYKKIRGENGMKSFANHLALALSGALSLAGANAARAQISDNVVRVGVLNDISGIFQDTNGMGSVEAARMAAEDFNGGGKGIKVEIVYADHQNKADVGQAIARKWLDVEAVDAIVDVPNSAVGLSINSLLRDSRMTFLASSTASSDLTGKACSPNTIQWVNDAWATGNTTAAAMMARGGKDWYFVTVDYALGKGIEAEATNYIEKNGGKVLGSSKHPLGTSDFASFLLQAQNSKSKVIGLANAGGDTINAVKQANEFGIQQSGQTMVAFLLFVNDVHGMGLKVAQGLQLLEAFYWDMDDDTRAFAKRFAARPGMNGKMPSGNQAGVYASTLAYLNAVAATGSDHAKDAVPQMKKFKGKDKLFGDVTIRQDGRVIHPMYLFEVKKPDESKYPYDYYKLVSTIPADQAFRPIADGGCSLVK